VSEDAGVEPRTAAALALMVRRLAIWLDLPIISAALSEDSKASCPVPIFVHANPSKYFRYPIYDLFSLAHYSCFE